MTTASELADDFEAANTEVVDFAESCTPDQWRTKVAGEEWPVCVLVHHVAEGHALVSGWIDSVRRNGAVEGTAGAIDELNALHATKYATVTVAEAVGLLRSNGAKASETLRSLSAEELASSAPFGPADGRPMPLEGIAAAAAAHARRHMASAMAAIGRTESG